jgi:hypothetical protein
MPRLFGLLRAQMLARQELWRAGPQVRIGGPLTNTSGAPSNSLGLTLPPLESDRFQRCSASA